MRLNRAIILSMVASCIVTGSARAAIVMDGGFTDALGTSYVSYSSGQSFGPWNVTSGTVDVIGNYWQPPVAGQGSVDLSGGGNGTISQSLNGLVIGTPYALTFALSGNPDGSPTVKNVQVSVDGQSKTLTFDDTGISKTLMNYSMETISFTYTGASSLLSFASIDDPSTPYGAVIGDVAIAAVPEPSSWALMIMGFAGVGLMAYRRRGKSQFRLA